MPSDGHIVGRRQLICTAFLMPISTTLPSMSLQHGRAGLTSTPQTSGPIVASTWSVRGETLCVGFVW
jgi:hypothetical protein